jgi:hypothetical protein
MFSFKKSLTALVGLLAFVSIVIALVPFVSRGQGNSQNGPPPFDVKVINSPSQPVPVTGTVSVSNLGSAPLPVQDVDSPGRQPVTADGSCSGSGCTATVYTVPAGKRLIVEYASITANIPAGKVARWRLFTNTGGQQGNELNFPLTQPPVIFGIISQSTAGQQVRLYAEAGSEVRMNGTTSDNALPSNYIFSISGYIVDVP